MRYSYKEQITEDVRDWVTENRFDMQDVDKENLYDYIYDRCFLEDSVTGNASGSYTFNRWQAREYIFSDLDSGEYLHEMISDGYTDAQTIGNMIVNDNWEWLDVSIRCYLLGEAVSTVVAEMNI